MKYILATILILLALYVTASDLRDVLKVVPKTNLTTGVQLPQRPPINDFSHVWLPGKPAVYNTYISETRDGYLQPYAGWYMRDFSEDPFDGKIDVLVVGEPLPSPTTTLFILLGVAGIIYWCRFKPQPV